MPKIDSAGLATGGVQPTAAGAGDANADETREAGAGETGDGTPASGSAEAIAPEADGAAGPDDAAEKAPAASEPKPTPAKAKAPPPAPKKAAGG